MDTQRKSEQGRARRQAKPHPILNSKSKMASPTGFTLIELLVVIAVVALLMAILLPVLGRVRKQARAVVCRMRLRQAGSLLSMYAQDHAGRFPDWGLNAWFIVTEPSFELYPKIATCPSAARRPGRDRVPWGGPFAPYAWPVTYADYDHGNWPDHLDIIYGSYGLNLWTYNEYERAKASRRPISEGVHWNVCDLRGASRVPVLLDCSWHIVVPHDNDGPPESEGHVRDQPMSMICFDRHNGGTNSLFMDWSVRKVGLKEPWTLKWHRKFDTANPWTKAGGVRPEDWPEWMRGFRDY